ncbi:FkbM family methyltransferase [Patescibacteria group bacterium]|nr:FkbM family methyltransferase [Patescibacteria group bacterium]
MKKINIILGSILAKIGNIFAGFSKKLLTNERQIIKAKFLEDEQKNQIRETYDLNADSVVIDVGGYVGDWTSDIYSRYCCNIHIFEPIDKYIKILKKRFEKNNHIIIHEVGLSDRDGNVEFNILNDGTSLYRSGDKKEAAKIVNAADYFKNQGIENIDLMKINIEGGEYALLQNLIDSGMMEHITDIQIQFHEIAGIEKTRMEELKTLLSRTHRPTYQYEYIWENWTKI